MSKQTSIFIYATPGIEFTDNFLENEKFPYFMEGHECLIGTFSNIHQSQGEFIDTLLDEYKMFLKENNITMTVIFAIEEGEGISIFRIEENGNIVLLQTGSLLRSSNDSVLNE